MGVAVPKKREFVPGAERWTARSSKFRAVGEPADRIVQFLASDGSIDRMGDTIDPKGWDCVNYLDNPVVLFAHDSTSIPIGHSVKVWGDEAGLHCQVKFDTDPKADEIFKKVIGGTLRAVSVGFKPLEYEWRAGDEELGDHGGIDFKRQELLEISIVPVPANANALAEERTKAMGQRSTDESDDTMGKHLKAFEGHLKTFGDHLKRMNDALDRSDAVDGDGVAGDGEGGKAFAAAIEKIAGLTSAQKSAILKAAAEAGHAMHPDVHKCVGSAHKALCKALDLHNRAAGAPPPQPGGDEHKPADEDDDEEDEKALDALLAKQKEIDDAFMKVTGKLPA